MGPTNGSDSAVNGALGLLMNLHLVQPDPTGRHGPSLSRLIDEGGGVKVVIEYLALMDWLIRPLYRGSPQGMAKDRLDP